MSIKIQSTRFGTLEVAEETIIEFPLGLIGLGGLRYALFESRPGSSFLWLHSLEDPGLALPVVDPRLFFPSFTLEVNVRDRELIGLTDPLEAFLYVTVRTAPDPAEVTVNLRAPLVIWEGRGHQVLNDAPGAELQEPLFPALARIPRGAPVLDAA
ncbi:MAG TPA: flagellar assembly protein FliW [Solirubrobacteraceae bacterium]|jgi:flagellar assembly factor FliW|nr:flagellar assembly protein FliW [Solirubrobacteraceae bacterium]